MKNYTLLVLFLFLYQINVNAQIYGNTIQNHSSGAFSRNYITYWKIITGSGDSGSFTHLGINYLASNATLGKLAIYSHNTSTDRPENLLGEVATFTPSTGLNVLPLLTTVPINSNTAYYIAFKCNISNFQVGSYNNNGSNQWPNGHMKYASHNFSDPWPVSAPYTSQYQEKNFTIFAVGNNSPLSVDLIDFSGELKQKGVELKWSTAAELNNANFEVQHSQDARNWTTIGNIAGNGNTLVEKAYEFLHDEPMKGDNFYRLRQIDYDGAFSFSDIITIRNNHAMEIVLFPNPSAGVFFIKGLDDSKEAILRVVNQQGHLVFNASVQNGSLDLTELNKGVYQFSIMQGNKVGVQTLLKH